MVPTSVIIKILIGRRNLTETFIATVLRDYGVRATITRKQDEVLRKKKLARSMPDGFWKKGDPLYKDPHARYIEAKLFKDLERRTKPTWFVG